MGQRSPPKGFVCYSHVDQAWLKRLQVHLKPLVRDGSLFLWSDTQIKSGQNWKAEIERQLNECDYAILIVSADFRASEFIAKIELPKLLASSLN